MNWRRAYGFMFELCGSRRWKYWKPVMSGEGICNVVVRHLPDEPYTVGAVVGFTHDELSRLNEIEFMELFRLRKRLAIRALLSYRHTLPDPR